MNITQEFYNTVRARVGDLYIWGAQGQAATESYIRSRARLHPGFFTGGRLEMMLYRAANEPGLKCFDCSGLANWALIQVGAVKAGFDTTAHGLFRNYCNEITVSQLTIGDLVFRYDSNSGKMVHMGIYAPEGVVEAAGGAYGVVVCPALSGRAHSAKSYVDGRIYQLRDWTHYGRLRMLEESEIDPVPPSTATVLRITKPLMRGANIKAMQTALNALGYPAGTADGICGEQTMKGVRAFTAAHKGV